MRTPHYLTPLKTTRIPQHHAVFDCETQASKKYGKYAHRWACGAAALVGNWGSQGFRVLESRTTTNPRTLWAAMTAAHVDGKPFVAWAHNLAFDLRVSEALRWLPTFGYSLDAIVLENTASWASFTGPAGKLTVCDLHSWLPVSLDRIAADMGLARPGFDYEGGTLTELRKRCKYDVDVTAEAVCKILNFLESEECGSFRPTGSGQSHAVWRRRFMPARTVLVHNDEHALERERTAMWAGRAEAWRYGEVKGPLYEHDMNLAYCRIAAEYDVPVKLTGHTGPRKVEDLIAADRQGAVLADVTVTTEAPVAPTGDDGRVLWPVGTFDTTLWGPELDLLYVEGANVTVHRTWRYRCEPVLAPMANWLIEQLEGNGNWSGSVVKRLLKHWARTLVGRCALRYRQWDEYGTVPVMGLSLSTTTATTDEAAKELLQVGESIFELAAMSEADSSVPQITSWVMSQARANLWEVIRRAGLENIYYVDTDSILVNQRGNRNLANLTGVGREIVLVHKATYGKAVIHGPRNIIVEDERRIAGIPKRAHATGELSFRGEVWTGLRSSIEGHQANQVGIHMADFNVKDIDPRRERTKNGRTVPYRMEVE